ncbi:MAG TPA: HlyD family secretion protein [Verrucomicrobiae bacterium]|jgi:membrane fusion protein (multidrug efflux system)
MSEIKTDAAPPVKSGAEKFNSPKFLWPAAVAFAVLLFFGISYLADVLTHESTDDAFIAAHVISIAPRVAGQVAAVHVLDNEMVRSNELLVEIDPADYAMTGAQKESSAEAQTANYQTILATLELMQAKLATAQATARESQADADAADATNARAQADFARAQDLRKQNTTSAQEFDSAQAAAQQAAANLNSAKQKALADASKIKEAEATLNAAKEAVGMALAQSHSAEKEAESAKLNLSYTKIFAPCDGRVTRKAVEAGDYLEVGQQIMSIVPQEVWVVANFKESQLEKMSPGQPVVVEIDALGGKKFRAHVDSIQAGSGASFSLLPPENATGNFVKVIQRVPVKIRFDDALPTDKTLGPGLSVTPSVQVGTMYFPSWLLAIVAIVLAIAAVFTFRFFLNREK